MFEKISKKQLTGAILAGVLTVAGATSAFAADLPNSNQAVKADKSAKYEQFRKIDISKMSASIKSALDSLVSTGTITQAQADAAIKAYTPGEGKEMRQVVIKKSPMGELVTAGTITQAQADAINNAMKSMKEAQKTPEDVLKGLVTAGTITQTQADAVLKGFTTKDRKFDNVKFGKNPLDELLSSGTLTQTQMDAIKKAIKTGIESKMTMEDIFKGLVADGTITEAQKEAVQKIFPNKDIFTRPIMGKMEKINSFDSLVTDGTITQAQADSIQAALKSGKDSVKSMKEVLDGLVTAVTITQAQEDAILKVFPAKAIKFISSDGKRGFLDKLVTEGTITQAQADAFNAAMKSARESKKQPTDILKELVAAGTITQTQADAIQKIYTPFEGKGLAMRFRNSPLDELVSAGTITQAQADAINSAVKSAMGSLRE